MLLALLTLGWPCLVQSQEQSLTSSGPRFDTCLGPGLKKDFYAGREYEFLSRLDDIEPRKPHRFLHAEQFYARDVFDLGPSESISLSLSDPGVLRFPRDLKEKDLEGLYVQAVVRLRFGIVTVEKSILK